MLLLAACGTLARDPQALDRVWDDTFVYLPGRSAAPLKVKDPEFASAGADAGRFQPLSAVIYVHGCAGFQPNYLEANYATALATAGYAVFIPDSFARGSSRKRACGHVQSNTLALRWAEVDSTLRRIQTLPWIDQRNLYLAGYSEGGMATATYEGYSFNAYFIAGWTCASPDPELDRIHAPRDRPVLAAIGTDDEYYPRTKGRVHCGNKFSGRENSRSIVLTGYDHGAIVRDPSVSAILVQFFDQNLVK